MRKIIMLKGLPGSGKTTFAKELLKNDRSFKRINKDDLRAMIDDGKWSTQNEKFIVHMRDSFIALALHNGYSVVVDDTNLAPKHAMKLKNLAKIAEVEFEEKFIDTPIEECIKRDLKRTRSVGEKVIKKMQQEFLGEKRFSKKPEHIEGAPNAIIVDIDGTLAIRQNRNPFDWKKVGQDRPNQPIVDLVLNLMKDHRIILVSGRDEVCRDETSLWLQNNGIGACPLFMRPRDNNEKDSIIKRRIYDEHIKPHFNVKYVIDDRNQVVEMWRELGLTCLQVAEGDF